MTVTNEQVKKLMIESSKIGISGAALKARMSEKTARKYRKLGKLPSELRYKREYRTRIDHFEGDWDEVSGMLQVSDGKLEAKTIMQYLIEKYPDQYKSKHLRTLQRKIKQWHCEYGRDKPVIFRQDLTPGRQSQSDWTHMDACGVTIAGQPFKHLLFHFMLPYSRHETVMVCYTESYETLSRGFEQAVEEIDGLCLEHRTDNLTAATQKSGGSRVFTKRWKSLLAHYDVTPSRNNPGESHENGSVEKSHDLFKKAVVQQLLLRGSNNFASLKEYEAFVFKLKDKRNAERHERFMEEKKLLKRLPPGAFNEASMIKVRVNPSSLIRLQNSTYSVPSRLIGSMLDAYIYRDHIDLYFGRSKVATLPRAEDGIQIDYRHIIGSLIRKPGAFESYQYKAALYPNVSFRLAYDALKAGFSSASKRYCELLHLAKMEGEHDVTSAIDLLLEAHLLPDKMAVLDLISKARTPLKVTVNRPLLKNYDGLLTQALSQVAA
jgi:hypothetical protein